MLNIIDVNDENKIVATVAEPTDVLREIELAEQFGMDASGYVVDGGDLVIWNLEQHAKKVGIKVGSILSAVTKDLQTQANIQAKFSSISVKTVTHRSTAEKAIYAASLALVAWVGATMTMGNGLKTDVNADIDGADWPEFSNPHAAVIAALVAEL